MSEIQGLENLQARLRHSFKDGGLLQTALTHRSFHSENRAVSTGHFERLEFLGDAVLGLIVSEMLMRSYNDADEGTLSKWRASLVNEATLSEVAKSLELGQYLNLGRGEADQRGNLRPRLLASAFEAILGAVYLDGGFEKVKSFLEAELTDRIQNLSTETEYASDFKTRLQEWSQKRYRNVPEYVLLSAEGPEHAKTFRCEVLIEGQSKGIGTGNSRKTAEQDAARIAFTQIEGK